ncbi:AbrB/MazE/SpoVT family DNA-binding domain-containing protein [Candidatus Venteria ishoeyi]|uniref:Uncharacterized protein n=1 Tax=Candidatus Venteria ishoeyi TaxID=1899563 RepID=A0A1H6FBQ3_9GAMM|nr:AbrB/MazE/SpoVT family DNA-binding domain-containing protein [Candidatus Venteria ishoeyi]SEH07512.1 Uncharacterised protein [Candidatus Venteria ishoeyi]
MKAIEFEAQAHDGVINIPETYQTWFEKPLKVILLTEDAAATQNLAEAFYLLTELSDDFMIDGRKQLPVQIRDGL